MTISGVDAFFQKLVEVLKGLCQTLQFSKRAHVDLISFCISFHVTGILQKGP